MTDVDPRSEATGMSWLSVSVMAACGTALCWWVLTRAVTDYTLMPWHGWAQGRIVAADVISEVRSTGDGKERPFFKAVITCAYEVDGDAHRLRLTDPQERSSTKAEADTLIRKLPVGTRVPVFYDRGSPVTAHATRTINLTYLVTPALLTIVTAWLVWREIGRTRPKTGLRSLAGYVASVPALLAYVYFHAFRVLDGKPALAEHRHKWDSSPDLIFAWLLFTLGFCLIAGAIAGRRGKKPAPPAKPVT